MIILFNWAVFRFHFKFQGCRTSYQKANVPKSPKVPGNPGSEIGSLAIHLQTDGSAKDGFYQFCGCTWKTWDFVPFSLGNGEGWVLGGFQIDGNERCHGGFPSRKSLIFTISCCSPQRNGQRWGEKFGFPGETPKSWFHHQLFCGVFQGFSMKQGRHLKSNHLKRLAQHPQDHPGPTFSAGISWLESAENMFFCFTDLLFFD